MYPCLTRGGNLFKETVPSGSGDHLNLTTLDRQKSWAAWNEEWAAQQDRTKTVHFEGFSILHAAQNKTLWYSIQSMMTYGIHLNNILILVSHENSNYFNHKSYKWISCLEMLENFASKLVYHIFLFHQY